MGKVKNYLLATAGLVILGGIVQFVMPLQAATPAKDVNVINTPLQVVVENGDETMVITLAEDQNSTIEFDAVDTSGFRFVSFLGRTDVNTNFSFLFSTQAGKFSDAIPKTHVTVCTIEVADGASCQSHSISGPFLLVRLQGTTNNTLQVFLSR